MHQSILSAVALGLLAASVRQAGAGFVVDDFETYASGDKVNVIGNGWGADDDTAVVTNLMATSGSNSVYVPPSITVSNAVNRPGASYPHVWSEFAIYDSRRISAGTEPMPGGREAVMMGINTGGYAIVYAPDVGGWVAYSNDVWGSEVAVATNAWATFAVFQNLTNQTAAVFLNGHLLRSGLPFINSLSTYNALKMKGGGVTNAFMDQVFISNAVPPSLTAADFDNDGVFDAAEIEAYGNVTTIRRLTNTVTTTGSGSINPAGTFTVTWNSNVTYTLTANEGYLVGTLTNNGADVGMALSGRGTRTGTYTDSGITNDHTIAASFVYNGVRYVPGDYATITGALAAALAGDRIVVSNGVYAESLVLSNNVMLVGTNLGANATNLTVQGALTVITGSVNVAAGSFTVTGAVTVAAGGLLTVSNTAAYWGGLSIGAGGMVSVTNGSVTLGGRTVSGTFTLDENWETTVQPSTLDFTDGFESYPNGKSLCSLGFYGWSASQSGAVVTNDAGVVNQGVNAAMIPAGATVTNTVSAAGVKRVWTELYLNGTAQVDPARPPEVNSNSAVMVFFGTHGYLTIYNPALTNWDICSTDVLGRAVATVSSGQWARVSIFQDFSNHTAAVFLNDRLLRDQVSFISTGASHYARLKVSNGPDGTGYVDGVKIWANCLDLSDDTDGDHMPDAQELTLFGNLSSYFLPEGSVFKIR